MKPYLIVTGAIFTLLAGAHLARTIVEWDRMSDPAFVFQAPGIGAIAAGLAMWAWCLYRKGA